MSNKGHENLIPQAHVLTVDEQSAGGRKSAEVRRERRKAKDTLNALLALPVSDGTALDPEQLTCIKDKQNTDVNTAILVQLVNSALHGNIRAIQEIYTLTQERNTRMQIEPQITDESLMRYEEYLSDFFRLTDDEPMEVDHSKMAKMFEFYVYIDDLSEISKRFNSQQLQEINKWFNNADDAEKIDFTHKVLANDKIPKAESLMLYEQKYLPEVRKHFKSLEPPQEPQTLDEYFDRT